MHKAAGELVRTNQSIAEIGASVGFPEVHSFTRTFKTYYGTTPGTFRNSRLPLERSSVFPPDGDTSLHPVDIIDKPNMRLAGLWHRGDYMAIGQTFESVMAQCAMSEILPHNPVTLGVYMADPDINDTTTLESFAGVLITESTPVPEQLSTLTLPGGRFAMMTHHGAYALLNHSYQWLYGCWLPQSGMAVRDVPCFEIYLNSPVNTQVAELRTGICLGVE